MDLNLMVTPWISESEWQEVFNLISSLEASKLAIAEEIIAAWQCRVDRLPTGVETTLCLIQAALAWCENPESLSLPLTFSSAIIRFLNLTSHVGFNKFGLSKIHEVAEKFNIPASLVDLRHDTTHGEMKSKESLLEGLAVALKWTLKNYWQWEAKNKAAGFEEYSHEYQAEESFSEENEETKRIRTWLECFQYLKIYSIWGNETLGEIKNDIDTYEHIVSLWSQLTFEKNGTPKTKRRRKSKGLTLKDVENVESSEGDFEKVRLREAIASIRNALQSWLSRRNERSPFSDGVFVKTLVNENLLLPDRDFVESLLENDEVESKLLTTIRTSPILPKNLAKSWSDVLRLLSETGLLPSLVKTLYDVCADSNRRHSDSFSKDLAAAWICDILRCLHDKANVVTTTPSKGKSPKPKYAAKVEPKSFNFLNLNFVDFKNDPVWQSLFQHIVMNPNERSTAVLPTVAKMVEPTLTISDEKRIQDMMDIFLGKKIGDVSKQTVNSEIKTLDSLINVGRQSTGGWRLVDDIDWASVPIGLCPGQTEESFLRSLENLKTSDDPCHLAEYKTPEVSFLRDLTIEIEEKDWAGSTANGEKKRVRPRSDQNVPAFYRAK